MYFCEGLKNAATDDDKFALTTQVINTAVDLKGKLQYFYKDMSSLLCVTL